MITTPGSIACVYLILAHTDPDSVLRLATTILAQSATAHILIHYDAKAGKFPVPADPSSTRITIVEHPIRVEWGTFSQIEAIATSLQQLRRTGAPFDWVLLLSAQDYPVRPIADFEAMLATAATDAFITYDQITPQNRHLNDRYKFHYKRILPGPLPRIFRVREMYDRIFNRIQPFIRIQTGPRGTFLGRRVRPSILDLPNPVYKGWQWWAITHKVCDVILSTIEQNPEFVEKYNGTLIPDESFFQTLILNSPELKATNLALHYADWQLGKASPAFLTFDNLPSIQASQRWFARKITTDNDGGLRNALDDLVTHPPIDKTQ
jgi:hypothetical protein